MNNEIEISAKTLAWLLESQLDGTDFPPGPARTSLEKAGLLRPKDSRSSLLSSATPSEPMPLEDLS